MAYAEKEPFQTTVAPKMTPSIDGDPSDWEGIEGFTMSFAHGQRGGDPNSDPLEVEIKYAWDDDNFYHMITEISDDDPSEGFNDVDWCQECSGSEPGPAPWSTDSIGFYDKGIKWPGISDDPLDANILETGPWTQYWVGLTTADDMEIDGVPQYRHLTRSVNTGRSEGLARLIGPESVPNESGSHLIPDLEDVELTTPQSAFSIIEDGSNGGRGKRTVEFYMPWEQIRYNPDDPREGVEERIEELYPGIEGHLLSDVKEGYEFRLEPLLVDGIEDYSFGSQTHPSGVEHPHDVFTYEWEQISVVRLGPEQADDPYSADALRGVNQIKNPGFEDAGPGGEGDSDLWVMNQQRPWGTRVNYDSHSGDWSLEVDNTAPSDFGRWKEGKTDDPTEHIGGPIIDPGTGDEVLPENCRACYPLKPNESYTQSMWVKLLEMPDVDVVEGEPAMHIYMGMRVNWVGVEGQNGGSGTSEKFYIHELPLNEWTKLENTVLFPENDINGNEIYIGQPIYVLDMDEGGEENLTGLMLWDDVYWGLTPDQGPACDVNGDGTCDASDIDAMSQNVIDGTATAADRNALIESAGPDGFNTYVGDSDLNGQFDEQDIVAGFIAGEYLTGNQAGWAEGDWDGNLVFTDQDFVAAFIAGGYLQGPRMATAAVPEPSSLVLLGLGLLAFARRRR